MENLDILSQIRRLADLIQQDSTKIYSGIVTGFESRWFLVMNSLMQFGPTGVTDLAVREGVTHPLVNRVANELIAAGLVAAYRDRGDKRKRVLALTSEGRQAVNDLLPLWSAMDRALSEILPADLAGQLAQLEKELRTSSLAERVNTSHSVGIIPFREDLADDFRRLNEEWISRLFKLEAADRKALGNPKQSIIAPGGQIIFAVDVSSGQVLGTCAMVRHSPTQVELAKMAVSPAAQGRGIGRLLGQKIVALAREGQYRELILETNSSLAPALAVYNSLGFEQQPFPVASDYSRADVFMRLTLTN